MKVSIVMNGQTCPICEIGQLTPHTEKVAVEYLGQQGQIDSQYKVCDCCGSEQVGTDEVRFNNGAIVVFKNQVQDRLTGSGHVYITFDGKVTLST